MKVSDYVFEFIKKLGIEDVFMLCGGGCMHLTDSVGKSGLRYIPCLHEQAAAVAAIGYSQYKNEMGVVLVTTGPGGTNTITGVAGAWADSMPLLVLSGQVKTADLSGDTGVRMLGFQEVDIVNVVKPITKYAATVLEPDKIRWHLEKAVYEANHGRKGPVWLDIPLDVQAAQIDADALEGFQPREKYSEEENHKAISVKVKEAYEMLKEAKRPVILAGYGIRHAGAYEEFIRLAKALDIPVLTTWKAIDFLSDDDPLYFGRPGSTGQRGANFMLQNCDLLLSLGARMDYGQIGYEHRYFARGAKKIVVDCDPSEFKKYQFHVELPIIEDVKQFICKLLELEPEPVSCADWKEKGREWNRKYPVILPEFFVQKTDERMSTYAFTDVLTRLTTENYVHAPCCSGVGVEIFLQAMHINPGVRAVINCPGLGAMGFDIPNALGAALASGKITVCVAGDGGFQINIQELETIRRKKLPVKFFVLNNGGYGSITNMQRNYFGGFYVGSNEESGLTLPMLSKTAAAYDCHYRRLDQVKDLEKEIKQVLDEPGCSICEVIVKEDEKSQPRVSSYLGRDGKMYSRPLEDLWPFLPREEFYKNMIVPPVEEQ